MNSRVLLNSLLAGTIMFLHGCGAPDAEHSGGAKAQKLSSLPKAGFLPYPIKIKKSTECPPAPAACPAANALAAVEYSYQTFARSLGPSGEVQRAWAGRLGDLFAADAYAQCVASGLNLPGSHPTGGVADRNDSYLSYLRNLMQANMCTTLDPGADQVSRADDVAVASDSIPRQWLASRKTSACNIDTTTNQPAAISPISRTLPAAYTKILGNTFGLTSTTTGAVANTFQHAAREVAYADLNLCMAQQLRDSLNGADVLFASGEDQLYIQGILRERAQLAVLQYSKLAKVFASPDTTPTSTIRSGYFLIALRKWAEGITSQDRTDLAADYRLAVNTLIDATTEMTRDLTRRAGALWSSGSPLWKSLSAPARDLRPAVDRPGAIWGLGAARVRMMNLIYGGEPLGSLDFSVWPYSVGAAPNNRFSAPFVSEPSSGPQVQLFLRLARQVIPDLTPGNPSGAFQLRPAATPSPVSSTDLLLGGESQRLKYIDVDATTLRMYRRVEVNLRRKACLERGPSQACAEAEVWKSLPAASTLRELRAQYESYLLFRQFRVEPDHAAALVRSLSDALGSQSLAAPALASFATAAGTVDRSAFSIYTDSASYLYESSVHITGEHSSVTLDPDPGDAVPQSENWIQLDPLFGIVPLRTEERAAVYLSEVVLPRRIFLDADPFDQGFGTQGYAVPFVQNSQRRLGSLGALAYAREAIVAFDSATLSASWQAGALDWSFPDFLDRVLMRLCGKLGGVRQLEVDG